ncbi:MAG: aspartate aminotransferase family protein, partial [Actinobacteria bacterium]|nr:aspartate aminotransferase family protein [Actinomycetota bacterium]
MTRLWHSFADMGAVSSKGELVLERGQGVHVFDTDGNRYIDATAGLWFCNVGHGRKKIAAAAAEQMGRLASYSTFGDFANPPALALAERVAALAPDKESVVFLTSGGSDSVDTAKKLALRLHQMQGEQNRDLFVVRQHAYHGMHLGGTSLAGIDANVSGYGDIDSGVVRVDWDSVDSLRAAFERIGPERIAAFFCEPVIGAGGVWAASREYLSAVRQMCRDAGVLFVADEVVTGFGRVGDWFASGRFELDPDLILCAKGLSSGYVPIGAVIAPPHVYKPFWEAGSVWRHGYTYSGHAAAAAASLANLDIIDQEGLLGAGLELETQLTEALKPVADHELVDHV